MSNLCCLVDFTMSQQTNLLITLLLLVITCATTTPIRVHQDGNHLLIDTSNYQVQVDLQTFALQVAKQETLRFATAKNALRIGQFVGFWVPAYLGYLYQFGINSYFQQAQQTVAWKQVENVVVLTVDSSSTLFVKNHTFVLFLR